jgi:protein involved in polysaccharide export with SLBB domain
VEPIYVLGAVRAPGALETRESVTVAEAIALAQGLSEAAAPRWAVLIGADGRERRIDVLGALQGAGANADLRVAPGETLLVSAQFRVTVVGRVEAPGRYPVEEGDRVTDVLAAAGGLAGDAARAGRLVRADGRPVELDLEALETGADPQLNAVLGPGDTLVIPRARRRVALVGAFVEPGKYDFDPGDRVSDALALARDVHEDALLGQALLMRDDGRSVRLDLGSLLNAEEKATDPELIDGDTLVLPRATERVAVVGMVADPGPLLLEPGMTLMDAIGAAGGWDQEEAHADRTILWRQGDHGPEMLRVNAHKLLRGDPGVENPALVPGDIVYVPRDSSMSRDEVARLLLGVSGLLRIAF